MRTGFRTTTAEPEAPRTLALVLCGGRGSRLGRLTDHQSKPAVHFAGRYRLVDFTLSNCLHSGIDTIGVLTQYMPQGLNRHIQLAWNLQSSDGSPRVHLLPAHQRAEHSDWYAGTADAVAQNLDLIEEIDPELVLILSGDHAYRMDYRALLNHHLSRQADLSIACIEVERETASAFGVIGVDDEDRIVRFSEKPADPEPLPDNPDQALVSMGVYVFNADLLRSLIGLIRDNRDGAPSDFGHHLIPMLIEQSKTHAWRFRDEHGQQGWWRDVGTLDAYWQSQLELAAPDAPFRLDDPLWPIRTANACASPTRIHSSHHATTEFQSCLIAEGCTLGALKAHHCVLSRECRIEDDCELEHCVILPGAVVEAGCRLRRVIVEPGCVVPPGSEIGFDPAADATRFTVSDKGVVLVTAKDIGATAAPLTWQRSA